MTRALVLSGGGMFGAWQAGAWAALAGRVQFDLVVGASVGSLNGYAIACGVSPEQLRSLWLDPAFTRLGDLRATVEALMSRARPTLDFAVTATDLLHLKPRVFRGHQVAVEHLIASCALPLLMAPVRIEGRFYSDGGLLNALPVWAAVELGATHILALHALPRIPSRWLRPPSKAFQSIAGFRPPVPPDVTLRIVRPPRDLGTLAESICWERARIERWLDQGEADARAALADGDADIIKKTFPF